MLTLLIPPDSEEPHGLRRGVRYVFDDHNAAEYIRYGWGRLVDEDAHLPAGQWQAAGPANHDHVLLRSGGFGDLIALRPLLLDMRRKSAGGSKLDRVDRLAVCCHPAHAAALDGLEGVEVLDYPPTVEDLAPFHWRLSLEGAIEDHPELDSVAALARAAWPHESAEGGEWCPTYRVRSPRVLAAWLRFPATEKKRLGIALHSSAHCRNWPIERLAEFIQGLGSESTEVFLFGKPGPWPELEVAAEVKHIHVLPRLGIDMRESLALLATLDALVAPDSGLVHAAGAMGVPTVALFGPFEPAQRVARYASVRALQGRAPCSPCLHHPRTPEQRWPAGKPCQTMQHCVAMAGITGEQVLQAVREILETS